MASIYQKQERRAALALLVGVPLFLLTACNSRPASPVAATPPAPSVPSFTRAVCIDPTASTAPAFSHQVRTLLASAVGRWAAPPEPSTQAGAPGQPGLDLTIRMVSTTAFSSDETNRHIVIPAVPALAARPDVLAEDFQQRNREWQAQSAKVKQARATASAAAAKGARTIAALPLDSKTRSGITACAAALAVTTPPGADRAFMIASDLDDNQAPQLAGSFAGAPLTLLQPCPSGSAARCTGLANAFSARLARLHRGPVTVVRPELADTAIPAWLGSSR